MSSDSESDDEISTTAKKKCATWKRDGTMPIPLKTQQRWDNMKNQCNHDSTFAINLHSVESHACEELDDNDDLLTSDAESLTSSGSSSSCDENYSISLEEEWDTDHEEMETTSDMPTCSGAINTSPAMTLPDVQHLLADIYYNTSKPSLMKLDGALVLILDFYVKNKLKLTQLDGFLKIMQLILPQPNNMPQSVFKLFSYVKENAPSCNVIKHYYCGFCIFYFGEKSMDKCPQCIRDVTTSCFFFEYDIIDQLKNLFENANLAEKLCSAKSDSNSSDISDITDGSEYKRVNNRDRGKHDITLILNTDGLCLSNSSTTHCWPLMATIAELPEYIRESYMLVLGLWFDPNNKPNMNVFLKPFCIKLQACYNDGIEWTDKKNNQSHVTKVVAPVIIADAPARSSIQNILNFNGRYGCNLCEIATKSCTPIEGVKNRSAYLFDKIPAPLRTGENMRDQALEVQHIMEKTKKPTHLKGVKGPSIISVLPLLDLGTCFVPEHMHSVLLGVVKQITTLWLENKSGKWNLLYHSCSKIDEFLTKIKPPYTFNRMPRPITSYKQYKASEFQNWLLYYSLPALQNFLPEAYFQHWMLLVVSMYNLLKKTVTSKDLEDAEKMLNVFVEKFAVLYGDRECSYNIHQLIHLPLCVKRWGPLWVTSAFQFENFNGIIASCVHGSKHLGQEISNYLTTAQGVQTLKRKHDEIIQLRNSKENKAYELLSKIASGQVSLNEKETELLSLHGISVKELSIYSRIRIKGDLYTSELYKIIKTNSHTVQLHLKNDATSSIYASIRFFFEIGADLFLMIRRFQISLPEMFVQKETRIPVRNILPVKAAEHDEFLLIKSQNINFICHLVKIGEKFICKPPTNFKKVL